MDIINILEYADETLSYNHAVKSRQSQEDYLPHSHDVFELIFLKRGNMTYTVDGQRYRLQCDDLVISRPFDIHCLHVEGQEDYERYNILFDESVSPFPFYERIPRSVNVVHFRNHLAVTQLFDKMDFYCDRLEGKERKQMLTNLIQEVLVRVMLEADSAKESQYTPANVLVCAAISYIDDHLLTLGSIEEICRELYITKSHLHHLFAEHLGISPKKYVTHKRLALAQREIASGGRPTEVCVKCGFSDYSAFYRAYRSRFGRKPSERVNVERAVITHDNTPRVSLR
ncbi:MAG: helix-turn-helix transcriptional regulator [Clostridia bacterium]|nr:helix-turn-helix transcriptional regulator [Clostridia bacterium]